MPDSTHLLMFGLIALGMVLTPGPNMIYLISRSICQGRRAGLISLGGVALGFVFYMLCAAFGITAFVFAVPYAYDTLRFGGAFYLLPGKQSNQVGGRRLQCGIFPSIPPENSLPWGLSRTLRIPKSPSCICPCCLNLLHQDMVAFFFSPWRSAAFRFRSASWSMHLSP